MADRALSVRELNRALLARQGLLERLRPPLVEAVEAIGAIQAQNRQSIPAALRSRVEGFEPDRLLQAFEEGELVVGPLLRGTIHAVSARQHPYYAAAVEASGVNDWRRAKSAPNLALDAIRRELHEYASSPKRSEELVAFIEDRIQRQDVSVDPAELNAQRSVDWRPLLRSSMLIRVAAQRTWTSARPIESLAAAPHGDRPAAEEAIPFVVRAHLRAFGPASAGDVSAWVGLRPPQVKAALETLAPELERFTDQAGRPLFDLTSALRPSAQTPASVRLLPWFDSTLLAYEPAHRARILPPEYRDRVYLPRNLQWLPTFLVDGLVAGTWALKTERRATTLTLQAFTKLPAATRKELQEEAEGVVRAIQPAAPDHRVVLET